MFYKILEKYSQLKSDHNLLQSEENRSLLNIDEDIISKFLELYDKDVKVIHSNQEAIEKDLQFLYKETDKLTTTTKQAVHLYDDFVENLKEAGDLFNWCSLLEQEMSEIHGMIASKYKATTEAENLDQTEKTENKTELNDNLNNLCLTEKKKDNLITEENKQDSI